MNEAVLINWFKAHKIAEANPRLLCKSCSVEESEAISKLCGQRMKDCDAADEELFKLEDVPLLNLFKEAKANLIDCGCKYSSSIKSHHKECWDRMSDWFAYRDALMVFIYERYIRHTAAARQFAEMNKVRAEEVVEGILDEVNIGDMPIEGFYDLKCNLIDLVERELW